MMEDFWSLEVFKEKSWWETVRWGSDWPRCKSNWGTGHKTIKSTLGEKVWIGHWQGAGFPYNGLLPAMRTVLPWSPNDSGVPLQ